MGRATNASTVAAPPNMGVVAAIRGSVVDVRFLQRLPAMHSMLRTGAPTEAGGAVAIEVMAHLDAQRVRGIALTPTQGLARGMPVTDTGAPLQAPVGPGTLGRMFDVFGTAIDGDPAPTEVQWRTARLEPKSSRPASRSSTC